VIGFYTLIFLVALLDQGIKLAIKGFLSLNQSINLIPGVLSFTYIENPGAAFGLFRNKTLFFLFLTLVLFGLVYVFRKRIKTQPFFFRFGMGLGLGGALGNFIDRLQAEGKVVDYLDLEFWPMQNWPVFNLADAAIIIGAVIIFIYLMKDNSDDPNKNPVRTRKGEA